MVFSELTNNNTVTIYTKNDVALQLNELFGNVFKTNI